MKSKTWAVIGGGNGGQAIAGHLASMGEKVRIFDVVPATVDAINDKGGIEVHYAVEAFGKLEFATTDISKAMGGADVVILTLPSIYHESMAEKMIPHLQDGQVVFLHPEASCGAIAFRKKMKDMGSTADVVVGASCSLLYAARAEKPGVASIFGIKNEVLAAALPAKDNEKLKEALNPQFPQFKMVDNVLATSLDNGNAMVHPGPTILNTSRIEAEPFVEYKYYWEGITPSIGKYVEAMDRERIAIGKAFGINQRTICQEFLDMYACGDENTPLYQLVRNNEGYSDIYTASTLRVRYILEDIPYSLVAIKALAQIAGVETPCIDAIITIGKTMLAGEIDEGRTAKMLGIDKMSKDELLSFVLG